MYLSDSLPHATRPSLAATPFHLLSELDRLNNRLSAADLRPSPETNAAFERLVELCTSAGDRMSQEVLAHPQSAALLRSLRGVSARGETQLERHWATTVTEADDAWAALHRFPYLDNYRNLVRVELGAASAAGATPPRTVVVLGAGPLPLTGLVLAHEHDAHVINVDCDGEACALGAEVAAALSLSDAVRTVHADAADAARLDEIAAADLVVLAALVGDDSASKRRVLDSLSRSLSPRATLLVRSAHRMRTALYPSISPDDLHGFRPLLEVHPCDDVVNSVLVARPA